MTLNLKTANQSSCTTLAHDIASPYRRFRKLQKVQQLKRYHPDEQSLKFCTFPVTLSWTKTKQSNLFTRQSTLYHQTKFSCKRISNSDNMSKKSHFHYIILHCDLDLEDSKPIFLNNTLAHGDVSLYQVW